MTQEKTIVFGSVTLKEVPATGCVGCYFLSSNGKCKAWDSVSVKCSRSEREDKQPVIFVPVEQEVKRQEMTVISAITFLKSKVDSGLFVGAQAGDITSLYNSIMEDFDSYTELKKIFE